jgi:hypothetical protein
MLISFSLSLMTFWTWAKVLHFIITVLTMLSPSLPAPFHSQGLEDRFVYVSRRRLDGFIVSDGAGPEFEESEKREETEVVQVATVDVNTSLYYVNSPLPGSAGEVKRNALTRLPIFAIFHGMSHERGVPPSFTGPLTSLRPLVLPQPTNLWVQDSSSNGLLFPVLASF